MHPMRNGTLRTLPLVTVLSAALALSVSFCLQAELSAQAPPSSSSSRELIHGYCVACHDARLERAGLRLDLIDAAEVGEHAEVWEKVVRKLRTGLMPPPGRPQPPVDDRNAMASRLEASLDAVSAADPNPGRTETLRRLNRTEYQNSIRDLLSLDIDATSLLPSDESGYGFDNVTVGDLPPVLLDRYISAAQKISRLAVGTTQTSLQSDVIRVPADFTQEEHVAGLPIGTRGGVSFPYTFAQDGAYDIQIRLARNRTGNVGGLRGSQKHKLDLLLDRKLVATFPVARPDGPDHSVVDKYLRIRTGVTAGPHEVGVAFHKQSSSLLETERQPLQSHFNEQRHPRLTPAVYQVSITGPYAPGGAELTPSRRRIFGCQPTESSEEEACAREILSTLMRRAYRRPVSDADVASSMAFYREARAEGDFDAGIGNALSAVLINPEFLFRVELDSDAAASGAAYRISDLELASRLSFFLWSSIPDEELLDVAIRGELSEPRKLERQVRRLLADQRSYNLASNFAGQWLQLRNLESFIPNIRLYPDFDDNLRRALREETERFFDHVVREDRSVLELLSADYTFLNERLARHYDIPGVIGSRFRHVALANDSQRGGLLRHGSILAVTSYATRTSPVLRGKFVLDKLYGAPPPPPLPNVPALDDNSVSAALGMRERLAEHRSNPVCARCHSTIDPVGFALENFDAVGRWRDNEGESGPIDVSGGLPGVGEFEGVAGLEAALLSRPELFAGAVTEKLLTFALGRGVEYYDAPAIRQILREAEPGGYRLSSLILGIVESVPFQMRGVR